MNKRKKKLSKAIWGSSHTISLPEIEYVYQDEAEGLIIGTGQHGVARLSEEASEFLEAKHCRLILKNTPEALEEWNRQQGKWLGLFHITC